MYIYTHMHTHTHTHTHRLPGGTVVKNPPAIQETYVRFLGGEDPLEQDMATHSSILSWEIPWTEEPGRLWVHGVAKHDLATKQQHLRRWLLCHLSHDDEEKTQPFHLQGTFKMSQK